jgi:hypothetical protein
MDSSIITILIYVGVGLVAFCILLYGIGFTSVGTDEVGIVEKWWSFKAQYHLIVLSH